VIRRLLAWLRTWGAMESTGRYAWGPDDPPADDPPTDDLTDAEVIARMEAQFDTNEEAGP
jgi:hypothetical protein